MSVLSESKIERLVLPSTKDKPEAQQDWVDFETNPGAELYFDATDLTPKDADGKTIKGTGKSMTALLATLIHKWSFTLIDGSPAPVSYDTVKRLDPMDVRFLIAKINESESSPEDEELTKKPSSPSTPVAPAAG